MIIPDGIKTFFIPLIISKNVIFVLKTEVKI